MDPQTTWQELLATWQQRDWESVIELSQALLHWLAQGGFPPAIEGPRQFEADWNRAVAEAFCHFALLRAQTMLLEVRETGGEEGWELVCAHCLSNGPATYFEAQHQGRMDIQTLGRANSSYRGICPDCQA